MWIQCSKSWRVTQGDSRSFSAEVKKFMFPSIQKGFPKHVHGGVHSANPWSGHAQWIQVSYRKARLMIIQQLRPELNQNQKKWASEFCVWRNPCLKWKPSSRRTRCIGQAPARINSHLCEMRNTPPISKCFSCGQKGHFSGSEECPAHGAQCHSCHKWDITENSANWDLVENLGMFRISWLFKKLQWNCPLVQSVTCHQKLWSYLHRNVTLLNIQCPSNRSAMEEDYIPPLPSRSQSRSFCDHWSRLVFSPCGVFSLSHHFEEFRQFSHEKLTRPSSSQPVDRKWSVGQHDISSCFQWTTSHQSPWDETPRPGAQYGNWNIHAKV